jgi:hypothetical protein
VTILFAAALDLLGVAAFLLWVGRRGKQQSVRMQVSRAPSILGRPGIGSSMDGQLNHYCS